VSKSSDWTDRYGSVDHKVAGEHCLQVPQPQLKLLAAGHSKPNIDVTLKRAKV
jgi:hypothetical protein